MRKNLARLFTICITLVAMSVLLHADEQDAFLNIAKLSEIIRDEYGDNVLYISDAEAFELDGGQTLKIKLTLYPARYIFLASGDDDASVVDVRLLNENGQEVVKDGGVFTAERDTYATFTVNAVGVYTVKILLEQTAEGAETAWVAWGSGEIDLLYTDDTAAY